MSTPEPGGTGLWLYDRISRLRFLSYRAKIMAVAFIGTHVPLIVLAVYFALQAAPDLHVFVTIIGVALGATLLGTAATLIVINQLLRPVLITAAALRSYRESRLRVPLPASYTDEMGTLMADAGRTLDHLESTLDTLEHVDEVTGLPNRKRFLELVRGRIARGQPVAVVALRFANLSVISEAVERRDVEQAVRQLSERLAAQPELSENFSRVGAAEFACTIGARRDNQAQWVEAAARVRTALERCSRDVELAGVAVKPILCGGLASFAIDGREPADLLDRAVASALQADARTPVVMHSRQAREAALHRFAIEQELRRAIANDEFELHYQPVVEAATGSAVGAEALIRWRHPTRGMVPPLEFIRAAETSGLIDQIGLRVIRHACAQLREWNDAGAVRLRVAINLSARQFLDPELKRHVMEAVEQHGVSPRQLEIELTETVAMVDHEHTRRVFGALREAGVGIALDDFGTGYASMSYLRKLPFDKLKIDREFVSGVHSVHHNQAICRALIELASGLGLKVLAEGAETEEEVRYLAARGCGLFQGFYFSRPLPAKEFARMIAACPHFSPFGDAMAALNPERPGHFTLH